jgi:PII-like signaling protein
VAVVAGVDGSTRGNRERAAFFSSNAGVPVLISAIVPASGIDAVRAWLASDLPEVLLEALDPVSVSSGAGSDEWQRLTVYGSERVGSDGRPLHSTLMRTVRREGGAGATAIPGIYGFTGPSEPRGDAFLQGRRRVPVITEIVDSASNCERWMNLAVGIGGSDVRLIRTSVKLFPA